MATSITSKAAVQLVANSSGFAAGLNPARQAMKRMHTEVSGIHSSMRTMFAGIGAYIGFSAFRGLSNGAIALSENMERLVNNANKMDMPLKEFRALSYASEETGGNVESLQKNLSFMMRNLSGVTEESKKTKRALALMGLDPALLRAAGPMGAFAQISDRIKEISDPMQRMSIAMSIFGKSGAEVLPLIMSGANGIADAMDRARELQSFLSEDEIRKAADLNDAASRMAFTFEGIKTKLMAIVAPNIISGLDKVSKILAGVSKEAWKEIGDWILWSTKAVIQFGVYSEAALSYIAKAGLPSIQYGWASINKLAAEYIVKLYKIAGASDNNSVVKKEKELIAYYEKMKGDSATTIDQEMKKAGNKIDGLVALMKAFDTTSAESSGSWDDVANWIVKANDNSVELLDEWERLQGVAESISKEFQNPRDAFDARTKDIETALQNGLITPEEANRAFADAQDKFAKAMNGDMPKWRDMSDGADDYASALDSVRQAYLDIQRAARGGQQVESFGGIAQARRIGMGGNGGGRFGMLPGMAGLPNIGFPGIGYLDSIMPGMPSPYLGIEDRQNERMYQAVKGHSWDAGLRNWYNTVGQFATPAEDYVDRRYQKFPSSFDDPERGTRMLAALERIAANTSPYSMVPQGVAL